MAEERGYGFWGLNATEVSEHTASLHRIDMPVFVVIYENIRANGVVEYKKEHPNCQIVVRFMHPKNWKDDVETSATNWGNEIAGKWASDEVLRSLDPIIYISNEMSLGGECNDYDIKNQWKYETKEAYQDIAEWLETAYRIIKAAHPEIKLGLSPLAYGHHEDGAPDDNGNITEEWAGYDYLERIARQYCDGRIFAHYYAGDGVRSKEDYLYADQEGTWHSLRWMRVLKMFEVRYRWVPEIWIDEFNTFEPEHPKYLDYLQYYAEQTLSSPHIGGVCIFLWYDAYHSASNEPNSIVSNVGDLETFIQTMNTLRIRVEGEQDMTWHKDFTDRALAYYMEHGEALNEAADYDITIEPGTKENGKKYLTLVGVKHLACEENHRDHHIYFDVRTKGDERMSGYLVQADIRNSDILVTSVVEKPEDEPGGNIQLDNATNIYDNLRVLSVNNEYPSDKASGFSSMHPDECDENTIGHHSFFASYVLLEYEKVDPPVEPPTSPVPPISVSPGCENMVALSNAGILFAAGTLSEAGYLEVVSKVVETNQ